MRKAARKGHLGAGGELERSKSESYGREASQKAAGVVFLPPHVVCCGWPLIGTGTAGGETPVTAGSPQRMNRRSPSTPWQRFLSQNLKRRCHSPALKTLQATHSLTHRMLGGPAST